MLGVQHVKAYVFDNDVIISGANLSENYFTNRQDRYFLIRAQFSLTLGDCEVLADYFTDLIQTIGTFSYVMLSSGEHPSLLISQEN